VSRSETADEEVDAETTHGLVTGTMRCGRGGSHDEPPPANDLTVLVDGEYSHEQMVGRCASEDAGLICVREVLPEV
jgi:hypothetical protein